jgi:hypothetical protein
MDHGLPIGTAQILSNRRSTLPGIVYIRFSAATDDTVRTASDVDIFESGVGEPLSNGCNGLRMSWAGAYVSNVSSTAQSRDDSGDNPRCEYSTIGDRRTCTAADRTERIKALPAFPTSRLRAERATCPAKLEAPGQEKASRKRLRWFALSGSE